MMASRDRGLAPAARCTTSDEIPVAVSSLLFYSLLFSFPFLPGLDGLDGGGRRVARKGAADGWMDGWKADPLERVDGRGIWMRETDRQDGNTS